MDEHPGECLAIAIHDGLHDILRAYLLGLLHARLGEEAAAHIDAARLDSLGESSEARSLADDFAWSVRAWCHWWASRFEEALETAERAQLVAWNEPLLYSAFRSRVLDRFLRGMLLERGGRLDAAEGWYASVEEYAAHDSILLAPSLLALGRIREQSGRAVEAARSYDRASRLLAGADPALQTLKNEALEGTRRVAAPD